MNTPARSPVAPAAVFSLLLLLSAGVVAAAPLTGQLDIRSEPGALYGDYALGEDAASFAAETGEDGGIVARIEVNGVAFDALYDPAGPRVTLDGQGRKLPVAEREVLRALVRDLERHWDPYRSPQMPDERLIFRLVLFLSDAPASFVFDEMTITAPEGHRAGAAPDRAAGAAPLGCEDRDDDDDTYIDCAPHVGEVCYDACDIHGFICEDANLGCDEANDCLGRCGAGCGGDGTGAYRQDCADHDACCRVHGGCLNPFDGQCGDEYREAAGDFIFADDNCEDCLGDCEMRLTLEREVLRPGEELEFEVYLHHRRPETVEQALRMRLLAPDGSVVAVKTSAERELAEGDEILVRESLRLPIDLVSGSYELMVGMDGMEQGLAVRSATVTVEE